MPKFIYKAKRGPKDEISGSIEAENKNAALRKLASMGHFPISIEEEDVEKETLRKNPLLYFRKVSIRDLSVFTRQLSDLLEAGLPLIRALSVLEKQTANKFLQGIIGDLRESVQGGNPLSTSRS